ncbi:UNVERIFIED_CONTAM: hypothetical protein FKN15_022303 [Acipenser sinensis]
MQGGQLVALITSHALSSKSWTHFFVITQTQWDRLKMSAWDGYRVRTTSEMPEEDGNSGACEEELELENKTCTSCKNCAMCCNLILSPYNLFTDAYHVIGLGYKFLLTLSVTQVACEWCFSTLKFVKNRLRSTMSQDLLEGFMLMSTEKEILMALDSDGVIDRIAQKSALLRPLLAT